MKRIVSLFALISFTLFFTGCRKNYSGEESVLYGTWVKGANAGDTLQFMKKNNQNIMRINESFNAGMPTYSEKEYTLLSGKLKIKTFSPVSQDYYSIDSFTWIQAGSEFKVQGIQLFMFMSSTGTYFTYRKI